MTNAVAEFKKHITFASNGRSGTITVSYQTSAGEQPARTARDVAQDLVDTFIHEQSDRIEEENAFLSLRLVKAEGEAEQDAKRFKKELQLFRSKNERSLPEDEMTPWQKLRTYRRGYDPKYFSKLNEYFTEQRQWVRGLEEGNFPEYYRRLVRYREIQWDKDYFRPAD